MEECKFLKLLSGSAKTPEIPEIPENDDLHKLVHKLLTDNYKITDKYLCLRSCILSMVIFFNIVIASLCMAVLDYQSYQNFPDEK